MSLHKGFSREWYAQSPYLNMWYRGWPIVKCPLDLWQYHEIIQQTEPELIVETGTFCGASALYLADQLALIGDGRPRGVVSIDIRVPTDENPLPEHPRIEFVTGRSSTDLRVLDHVKELADGRRTMVVLDSDHSHAHVLSELRLYSRLVTVGCYLIVEDTNPDAYTGMQQAGFILDPKDSAATAVKAWQPKNQGFEPDARRERFLFTQNPGGYLKRVR